MEFELCLFHTDLKKTQSAVEAGIPTIIIDWENREKRLRQKSFDTQINQHTLADLTSVRQSVKGHLICRIDSIGAHTPLEVESAIEFGADELLIPMVRTEEDVLNVLRLTKERVPVGILIETNDAIKCARKLSLLNLSRIYVGLNDLAIESNSRNLFLPIADGTIDQLRNHFSCPFGFAGLTLPDKGFPIPCYLIIAELMRLKANFSFLRRSFIKDSQGKDLNLEVIKLKNALVKSSNRNLNEIENDRLAFVQKVEELQSQLIALI